jgi:hypothetical protein
MNMALAGMATSSWVLLDLRHSLPTHMSCTRVATQQAVAGFIKQELERLLAANVLNKTEQPSNHSSHGCPRL